VTEIDAKENLAESAAILHGHKRLFHVRITVHWRGSVRLS
jgi:hypothetical protein